MNMNMKKIISWGMMLAATFTLTNCAKEIDAPVQEPESVGYPFEIIASTVDTKTIVNDDFTTSWAEGDQINLFHAVGESNEYKSDNEFTVKDVNSGNFTGNLSEELKVEEVYDWYALYPYSSDIKTPGQQTNGYTYIGGRSDTPQSQTGVDNMKHIAGKNYPLYGKDTAVGVGTTPELTMYQAATLLKVNVTNMLTAYLSVENIAFTAPEGTSLVGTFYLDITGEDVAYADGQYVSNVANLSVADATIAPDATASFYLAVKPFTALTGSELKIAVNGYEKTLKMSKDVTFTAGKIKTLKFGYDYVEEPSQDEETVVTISFANATDRTSCSTAEQVWKKDGVTFKNTKTSESSNVVDNVNPVRLYKNSTVTISAPSNISKIVFVCNSTDYAKSLNNSIKGSTLAGSTVSVALDGTSDTVTYTLSDGQVRMNSLTVTYVGGEYVPPVLESISISGYKTEFVQDETFSFDGVVTATYDDGSTRDVTSLATISEPNMSEVGTQRVTVTYEGMTATYEITVKEKEQGAVQLKTFTVKSSSVIGGTTTYAAYKKTLDARGWEITWGGNGKSIGTNSKNRTKCTLSSTAKYAVSPITTTSIASAFASTTSISNVSKISYAALSGGSNHTATKIYVLYSEDGITFSQLTLTNGTQGAAINATAGGEFEFASCSGYFAVVFVATNSSGNWRLDDVNLTFTYSE